MLTFESRTSSPLQQREWELSYSLRIIGALRLPLLFNHAAASFCAIRWKGSSVSGGRVGPAAAEAAGAPARLSVPIRDESSELAAPRHRGLCSLAKGCWFWPPQAGWWRDKAEGRKQEERGNIQKVPSGKELPRKQRDANG